MELFKLFGTIAINNNDANTAIDNTSSKATEANSKISGAFEKIGKAAVVMGTTVATGLAAGATAIGKLTKDAVANYADYEQLVGGVETLFKDSSDKVIGYANDAYKTAGLSANEYMETVTGFSASLLQSLATSTSESSEQAVQASKEALAQQQEDVEEANESMLEALKEAQADKLDALKESQQAELDALKEKQEEEIQAIEEANEAELKSYQELADERLKLIDEQYKENLKLIDEEKYNQLKAIDEQIAALQAEAKAETEAAQKKSEAKKQAELEEKVANAKTAEDKKQAEEKLAEYLEELQRKQAKAARDNLISDLKAQKDAVNEAAKEKEKAAKEAYNAETAAQKKANEEQLDEIKKAQKEQLDEVKKAQKEQLSEVEKSHEKELKSFQKTQTAELNALKRTNKKKLEEIKQYVKEQTAILDNTSQAAVYTAEVYELAADKANQALIDMSDNANKMGTPMESIKNAYQGFAKQNYTMLDNLKLGYGGTKEEMERLLKDAQAISGVEYDISSFSDMVDAIHVVQTEMGITGTTAEEAATTISGSIGMMKGAWTNLLTGMSDSSQDIDLLLNNFVDSVITVVGNIAPRLVETVPRLVEGLVQVVENLTPYVAPMIEELLPELLNGAARLVVYLVEHIPELVVSLGSALFDALKLIFSEVSGLLSPEAENSFSVISNVFQNIWDFCVDIWEKFGKPLVDGITQAVSDLTTWISTNSEEINETVDSVFGIISSNSESVLNFLSQSWENIGQPLIDRITDAVSTIAEWISSHADEISAAVDAALSIISTIAEDTWNFIFQVWDTVGQPLFDTITSAVESIAEWITTHADEINEKIDFVFGMISDAFALCWDVCQTLWDTVGQPIFDIICDTVEILQKWFEDNFGSMEEVVGSAFGEISVFWEEHLKPCFEAIGQFISEYLAPVFTEVFENGILPVVTEVFGFISDLWTYTLKPIFTGIIDFITGVFSGDWEKAWDGIVEIFKGIFNLIPTIVEGVINGAIAIINGIIYGINALTGLIGIPEIPEIPNVSIPRLEQGGVLEKGQVGLLEGNGAEAVVPLENNKKWISKVAADMNAETGTCNNETLEKILSVLEEILQTLPDTLVDAITSGTRFEVNNREFARLVKAVN